MTEEACPFCSPKSHVLMENRHALVILSNPRKVPGHTLVIPKRHVLEPWELTPQEITDAFELIFLVEKRLVGKLGAGIDIRQNYRPFMAQSRLKVNHVHFQLIPRYPDDYIHQVSEKFEKDLFADLDVLERKEVEKLLQ